MLTLTTGGPGTGKTAHLITELIKVHKQQPYRDFFIHGINQFTAFKHTTIYCRSPLCDLCRAQELPDDALFVEDWHVWQKSHYMIVIDEVQRIWGTSNGTNKNEAISRLQTHRHYGLDFWLVSQSPKLIHADVRAMVGRHIHLESKWSGRKQFEWSEARDNTLSRTDAVVRPYTLPKHIFRYYKSAEVHTTQEKRKPMAFYASILVLFVCVAFGYVINKNFHKRFSEPQKTTEVKPVEDVGTGAVQAVPVPTSDNNTSKVDLSTPEKLAVAFTPVIPALPWTAPVYKELAHPVSFPRVVGCIQNDTRCSCYTQQATLVDVPLELCRLAVKRRTFDMFKPDSNQFAQNEPVEPAQNFIKH